MPEMFDQDMGRVLISTEKLQDRVAELGAQLTHDYSGVEPLFVCGLRGSFVFFADLIRQVAVKLDVDFLATGSYGQTTHSSGVVRFSKDLDESIEDRHVVFVTGMVHNGRSLRYLYENFQARKPASLAVCTLLSKGSQRRVIVPVKYRGFEIAEEFVVGYGLDYQQRYRNLPYIGVLRTERIIQ